MKSSKILKCATTAPAVTSRIDEVAESTRKSIEQTNNKIQDLERKLDTKVRDILEDNEKVKLEMATQHHEQVELLEKRQKTTSNMFNWSLIINILLVITLIVFAFKLSSFTKKYDELNRQVAQLSTQYSDMLNGCRDISSRVNKLIEDMKELTNENPDDTVTEIVEFNLTDITSKSNLYANNFNDIIELYLADRDFDESKMSNLGEVIYNMENEYNVNGLFCLAVSALESTFGTSDAAVNKNNLFGFINNSGYLMEFDSPEDCVMYWGNLIRNYYIDAGLTTIDQIQKKYCPNSTTWAPNIHTLFKEFAELIEYA